MMMIEKLDSIEGSENPNGFAGYSDKFHIVSSMLAISSSRYFPNETLDDLYSLVLFLLLYFTHAVLIGEICAIVDVEQFVMNKYERIIAFFHQRVDRMDLTFALKVRI